MSDGKPLSPTALAAKLSSRRSPNSFAMKAAQGARDQTIMSVKSSESNKSAAELEIIGHISNSTRVTNKAGALSGATASAGVAAAGAGGATRIQQALDDASTACGSAASEVERPLSPRGAAVPPSPATRRFEQALRESSPTKTKPPKTRPDNLRVVQSVPDRSVSPSPRSRPPTPEGDRDRTPGGSIASSPTSSRRSLDLAHNDNAFHVIANLVVESMEKSKGDLTNQDGLDATVPPAIRESFCEAVRYRLKYNCPAHSQAQVHILTRKCGQFGLDKEGAENPLLSIKSTGDVRQKMTPDRPKAVQSTDRKQTIESVAATEMGVSTTSGSNGGSGPTIHQLPSFQVNSDSVASVAAPTTPTPPASNQRSRSPNPNKPPLPPSDGTDHTRRLRSREVELLESASIASVLTAPSGEVSNSESLARKQLMAELREASTLMAESQTPEAAEFWRNHVVGLQARLRSLHTRTDYSADGTNTYGQDQSSYGQSSASYQQSSYARPPPFKTTYNAKLNYYPEGQESSKPELNKDPVYGTTQTTPFAVPNPPTLEPALSPKPAENDSTNRARSSPAVNPPHVHPSPSPTASKHSQGSSLPIVDVVSPADLPAGYHFEAEIDGRCFLATVPSGGVKKGDTFSCVMRELERTGPSVPMGKWRDRLCDCLTFGFMHPSNILGFFCPLALLGQVMTRLSLDVLARPLKRRADTFKSMWTITIFWIAMNIFVYFCFHLKWSRFLPLTVADYVAVTILNVALAAFAIYSVAATRASVRDSYNIREHRCFDLEDFVCATFCMPCTVCQLSRHTAPYDEVEAMYCTKTGLPAKVDLDYLETK